MNFQHNQINPIPNQNRQQNIINQVYYLPINKLLSWASTVLELNELKNLNQLTTGAVFCQLLDACHPNTVRMNKVNWKAKCENDYISNFKLFQEGLNKNNIQKLIDVQRLIKGTQSKLTELLQWIYGYYINNKDNYKIYDAKKRRRMQNLEFSSKKKYKNKKQKNINKLE